MDILINSYVRYSANYIRDAFLLSQYLRGLQYVTSLVQIFHASNLLQVWSVWRSLLKCQLGNGVGNTGMKKMCRPLEKSTMKNGEVLSVENISEECCHILLNKQRSLLESGYYSKITFCSLTFDHQATIWEWWLMVRVR